MLTLRDFFHIPQLDPPIQQIVSEPTGLLVVAGLDPRRNTQGPEKDRMLGQQEGGFLPGGRHALFSILMDEILESQPVKKCIVVTRDKNLVRVLRQFRRRVRIDLLNSSEKYPEMIALAARNKPGLLVIDHLSQETIRPALDAARRGLRVLSQLDTIFRGAEVARQLLEMGASQDDLDGLRWVLAVQRLPALCPQCKQPAVPDPVQLERLHAHRRLGKPAEQVFYQAVGCPHCQDTGRSGDVAAFDVFQMEEDRNATGHRSPSHAILPMEIYVWELVCAGHLPLEDFLDFEYDQLRRTFYLFTDRERALMETQAALEGRLLQLQAAHKVLQQRTEALVSLQTIGQVMIASNSLEDLAVRLCHHACQLCTAERAILYTQRLVGQVEVLAVAGWDPALLKRKVDMRLILDAQVGPEPKPFDYPPPGVPVLLEKFIMRAGLAVSLYTQNEWVGLMILHTSKKDRFLPGEVALLQTFANLAALAIQRGGLVEQLHDKITQLEAAQVGLAQKERMEQEMELARQVQQSLLPHTFPDLPGFRFAARCEPARQVGGDFYDVISLQEGRFGVAIGDVSDKGMPAALYMAITRSLLRAEAGRQLSPAGVLTNVHHLLLELGEPHMFVTLFYGVIDFQARELTYARAGHDLPYLAREGQLHALGGDGVPLGMNLHNPPRSTFASDAAAQQGEEPGAAWFRLAEKHLAILPGDRFVLYTDGLTDVFNTGGQLFERVRLEDLLRANAHQSPQELCESIFAALTHYRGETEQYDDMTLLVVDHVGV